MSNRFPDGSGGFGQSSSNVAHLETDFEEPHDQVDAKKFRVGHVYTPVIGVDKLDDPLYMYSQQWAVDKTRFENERIADIKRLELVYGGGGSVKEKGELIIVVMCIEVVHMMKDAVKVAVKMKKTLIVKVVWGLINVMMQNMEEGLNKMKI